MQKCVNEVGWSIADIASQILPGTCITATCIVEHEVYMWGTTFLVIVVKLTVASVQLIVAFTHSTVYMEWVTSTGAD